MSEEQRLTTIIKWHEETEVVLVQSGALPIIPEYWRRPEFHRADR